MKTIILCTLVLVGIVVAQDRSSERYGTSVESVVSGNQNRSDWYNYKRDPFRATSALYGTLREYRISDEDHIETLWRKEAGFPVEAEIDKLLLKSLQLRLKVPNPG